METLLQDIGFIDTQLHEPVKVATEQNIVVTKNYEKLRNETKYLCFSGGGMCGVAYLGGLIELYQDEHKHWTKHLNTLKGCSGCSIGAITAVIVAAGVSPWDLSKLMLQLDLSTVAKVPGSGNMTLFGSVAKIMTQGAVNKQKPLQNLVKSLFVRTMGESGPNLTFENFKARYNRDIVIVAFNITKSSTKVFSLKNTPHDNVMDAVIASMSIPYLFDTFLHKESGDILCDGGVMECLPLLRTPLNETLAFGIYDAMIRAVSTPRKLFASSMSAPLHAMAMANPQTIHKIIFFDIPANKASDFSMTLQTKLKLIAHGRLCMAAFVMSEYILTRMALDMSPVNDPRPRKYEPEVLDPGEDDM